MSAHVCDTCLSADSLRAERDQARAELATRAGEQLLEDTPKRATASWAS